jgi:hypothetical protein
MLGRLSSTDKTLRLRMRLASNPGSIGAAWLKTMFLRGACPVHNPDVGEFVAPHLPAYEFAGEVLRILVAPQTQGQRRRRRSHG